MMTHTAPQNTAPLEIIMIEDDDFDAKQLRRTLTATGIKNNLTRCIDGVEALEFLRKDSGELPRAFIILLDINMPRMNGHEFLEEIRKDPKLRRSVVFVMSTSTDEQDINSAYDKNVAGYVVKGGRSEENQELFKVLNEIWKLVLLPEIT
ncbi:response regulator [Puniceibacterium sediminis]|uniref:CheY chemotaxis protein or a CheY-like REC (Receiver) domain n=1 Tax=Puniceibacterium sediminis TaxID=1608407 RepID=A0A238X7Y6_9RHOB|nr:response regulator [Puniceibacterium sediminis]SNR54728.1 CheY chemotaxis protein or a CheY-like REC (receiver) domain [Puniceibacterium sediminis]